MRVRHRLVSLVALAAATAAVPAEAAPGLAPWARIGEWEVTASVAGRCLAERRYPGGTQVFVTRRSDGAASLLVSNRAWYRRDRGMHRLSLVQSGASRRLAAEAGSDFLGLSLSTPSGGELLAQLAGGGSLEVSAPDGVVLERLDLGGLAPALERLGSCLSQVATGENFPGSPAPPPPPPPSRRGKARPARASVNLAELFSSDDYPASAARMGEAGAVGFRVDIDRNGRIAACTIIISSGSAALDSTTCRLLRSRARFSPALDRKGRPTEDSLGGRIVWTLPEPEPPPPPP